jgi:hypothetical protein
VQPVGPDDEVERARGRPEEGHVDAGSGLGERGDRVVEDVLGRRGGALVHDPGQVAADDLDLPAGELAGHDGERAAGGVDHPAVPAVRPGRPDVVEDAHPVEDRAVGLALEVDGLAAGAQRGSLLDDRDVEAVPGEPVGEGGAGDARAGDQDARALHVHDARSPRWQGADAALAPGEGLTERHPSGHKGRATALQPVCELLDGTVTVFVRGIGHVPRVEVADTVLNPQP